jgi:4-amino-4-deoxy-L-arabinose transferase-like glycosyltransferase
MEKMYENLKKNWKTIAIFSAIFIVAVFLRAYNFHDWLEFRNDQSRDAYLVDDVVNGKSSWPLLGPKMSFTGIGGNNNENGAFRLGPIYYYFQIISAKIFGDYPDKLAYPDIFFSILSIPLFYLFLRVYFNTNLSLSLTGLYAISAYFIHYSRYAWNTNLIPFFVLLFLVSFYKFLEKNEKTSWGWIILAGIALGIGIQLHAIIMILFSVTTFFVFLFSLKNSRKNWKKWAVIILIFFALNAGQIISELKTNFNNTKTFLNFPSRNNNFNTKINPLVLAANDVACHMEANLLFLYSYDNKKCSYYFSADAKSQSGIFSEVVKNKIKNIFPLVGVIFSAIGYFLLVYYSRKETEKNKKYFLLLIILYSAIAFLIMLPLSGGKFSDSRYFSFGFFMPFLFLGFFAKLISEKFAKKYALPAIITIFLILAASNARAISKEALPLLNGSGTCSLNVTTLGEAESVSEYMASHFNGQKTIYFGVNSVTLPAFAYPLEYLLKRQNIDSIITGLKKEDWQGIDAPVFILSCKKKKSYSYPYEKISNIYIYQTNK